MNNEKAACPAGTRTSGNRKESASISAVKHSSRSGKSQAVVNSVLGNLNLYMKALHIAAVIMQADGLCRYDTADKCPKVWPPDEAACVKCIKNWLLARARKEMRHG